MSNAVSETASIFDVSDKVVIVTGSGRGLGKTMAQGLATMGAKVVVCSRTLAQSDEVAHEIAGSGGEAMSQRVDVANYTDCQRLVESTVSKYGRIDGLVNNAGIDIIKPATECTPEDWNEIISINLGGYYNCAHTVGKQMLAQGHGGSIVNNSSIASAVGVHGLLAYGAAKGGVNQITRVLAVEWATAGVRVNAIGPGYFDNIMPGAAAEHARPEKQQQVITFTPMKRRGRPEELVGPVVFLLSEASSYVTGAVLFVDGGYTAM